MAVTQEQSRILNLPYDIRYAIYSHLFPTGEQIYLQALKNSIRAISPPEGISLGILLVCKQFHAEAGGYLYNNYLYNVVGTKPYCMARYRSFLELMKRHARSEVRVDAFSNGDHSATMCVSLQAGEAKVPLLMARGRGEARSIEQMEREFAPKPSRARYDGLTTGVMLCSLLFAVVAWLMASNGFHGHTGNA